MPRGGFHFYEALGVSGIKGGTIPFLQCLQRDHDDALPLGLGDLVAQLAMCKVMVIPLSVEKIPSLG